MSIRNEQPPAYSDKERAAMLSAIIFGPETTIAAVTDLLERYSTDTHRAVLWITMERGRPLGRIKLEKRAHERERNPGAGH